MFAAAMPACVVPPTLEEAPPPGNFPPAIVRDDPKTPIVPAPGLVQLSSDADLVLDSIPVLEPNVNDQLTLRLFLDGIPLLTIEPPPTGDVRRVLRALVDLPCALILPGPAGQLGQLVGVVSDRGFAGAGRETPPEAGTSSVEWVIDCLDAP